MLQQVQVSGNRKVLTSLSQPQLGALLARLAGSCVWEDAGEGGTEQKAAASHTDRFFASMEFYLLLGWFLSFFSCSCRFFVGRWKNNKQLFWPFVFHASRVWLESWHSSLWTCLVLIARLADRCKNCFIWTSDSIDWITKIGSSYSLLSKRPYENLLPPSSLCLCEDIYALRRLNEGMLLSENSLSLLALSQDKLWQWSRWVLSANRRASLLPRT